jgi:hypothetical protein
VIKFVSDLRQVGGFLRALRFPSPIKLTATIIYALCIPPPLYTCQVLPVVDKERLCICNYTSISSTIYTNITSWKPFTCICLLRVTILPLFARHSDWMLELFWWCYDTMKNNIYHTAVTVPKSKRKTEAKSIKLTHMYMTDFWSKVH